MLRNAVAAVACAGLLSAQAAADALRAPLPAQPAGVAWPTRAWPVAEPGPGVDRAALAAAVDAIFARVGRSGVPDGRALVVIHRGVLVAERYAPGFGPDSRFESWSLAKSVTNALVGIAVREGLLAVDAPAPVAAWQVEGDARRALTVNHLLHMTSGLANEDGGEGADSFAARLLFGRENADTFAFATSVALAHAPDSRWAYSTSTSTILAGLVQRSVGDSPSAMLDFMRRELFDRLGMKSPVPEFDAAGNFLGGSSIWISARDWARFGLLYLRDGVWEDGRVLPEGWVDYTRTPAPAPNNATFGAHFWVNHPPTEDQFEVLPGGPPSAFSANGANGQYVLMVPTRDLVVVRLGEMQAHSWPEFGAEIAAVVNAFPPLAPGLE